MSVTELSIKRPILFIVFFIVLLGAGLFSFSQLRFELLPTLDTPFVTIATVYPGAGPKEIETSVTKKLEDGLAGLSKLKRISGQSADNISIITLEFLPGTNVQDATADVQRAVSQVQPSLPSAVKAPVVDRYSLSDLPVLQIATTAKVPDEVLGKLVKEQIKPRIGRINNVGRISVLGLREPELHITANNATLNQVGLSLDQVVNAILAANQNIPAGNANSKATDLGIKMNGKLTTIDEIAQLPIVTNQDASKVSVMDVATVTTGKSPKEIVSKLNSNQALGINIQKQTGANAVKVASDVRHELEKIEKDYKHIGLKFTIAQDSSVFTMQAAKTVGKDFLIAIALVAIVMLVFLHSVRNAAIVMLAIPTSLASALIMMYMMNYSLNLMTLLAMSLVIGILVDDSIVVIENIYRHLEMGKKAEQASLDGRNEIGFSALSITLVDVVVFLPMAFIPGLVGSIIKEFSLVIVVSTLSSLVVSFTLTPMLTSRFAVLSHLSRKSVFGRVLLFIESGIDALIQQYVRLLKVVLKRPVWVIIISFSMLVSSMMLVSEGFVGSEFVPSTDKGEIALKITLAPGTAIDYSEKKIKGLESKLKTLPEVDRIYTQVGYQNDSYGELTSPNVAQLSVLLKPADQRTRSIKQVAFEVKKLASTTPGAQVRVGTVGIMGAEGEPIQIVVSASNRADVIASAQLIKNNMDTINGLSSVRLSAQLDRTELSVKPKLEELSKVGLTADYIGMFLRNAVTGFTDSRVALNDESDMAIRLRLDSATRNQPSALTETKISTASGELVSLGQVADIDYVLGASMLERRNKAASIMILAQPGGRPVGELGEEIKQIVAKLTLPTGVKVSYEGDLELQDDSFDKLGYALLASVILVYLIMVSLYNHWGSPFVVLFSVPMALIGALLALALAQQTLNIFSIFGMIMLIGLVAKNAILLVDRANEVRASGRSLSYALIDAGATRLRPILMTTIAMVIGMLPLALGKGAGSELNSPLAWVLVGGLTSSLLLTLVLVPAVYLLFFGDKGKFKIANWFNRPVKLSKSIAVVATLALILLLSEASHAQTLDLNSVASLAIERHARVTNGTLEINKMGLLLNNARSERLPTLQFNATYNRNIQPDKFFLPEIGFDANGNMTFSNKLIPLDAVAKNAVTTTFNLNLPLFDQVIDAQTKQAKVQVKLAMLNNAMAKAEIAWQAKRAFVSALLFQENVQANAYALSRSKELHQHCLSLYNAGRASTIDTLETANIVSMAKDAVIVAQTDEAQGRANLMSLLSMPVDTSLRLSGDLTTLRVENPAELNAFSRPEIAILKTRIEEQQAAISVANAQRLPRLSAIGQFQRVAQEDELNFSKYQFAGGYFVGLQLTFDIYQGGRNVRNEHIAKLSQMQQGRELQQASLETNNQLKACKARIQLAQERVVRLNNALELVKAKFERLKVQFSQGAIVASALTEATLQVRRTTSQYLLAVHDLNQAQVDLQYFAGHIN